MLKKIASIYFSFLVVSVLFFASQSNGYSQATIDEKDNFNSIVYNYEANRFTTPKSEIQYQEMVRRENERYNYAVENLKGIYQQEAANIAQAKKECGTDLSCRKYLSDEGKRLVNDYVKALNEVKNIFGFRRRQLNEARKNFTPIEMRMDKGMIQQNRGRYNIRIYERRIDPSISQQNRRRYSRRTN